MIMNNKLKIRQDKSCKIVYLEEMSNLPNVTVENKEMK